MTSLDIVQNPAGPVYQELIAFASEACASFSLVWRQSDPSPSSLGFARDLAPFLTREEFTDRWPGTQLHGHTALVRHYKFDWLAREILVRVPSLYHWQEPDYPEDLACYSSQGEVWLGSIAHERDAFFGPAGPTIAEIRQRIPGLRVELRLVE